MPNRLANESSLYLRQHANNPVDWYPWGSEALERARSEDRPIFLSVGYSACHWCHVMEHESFEDETTAKFLNDHFVSIKVDREERPDIDQIYMSAHQAMNRGGGGWPLSVFLTADGHPFYAGTYFPPEDRYQMPSFRRLLAAILDAWQNRRDDLNQTAEQVTAALQGMGEVERADGELSEDLLSGALRVLRHVFDATHGGFGHQPKFPHAVELRLLTRIWRRTGDAMALTMVKETLEHMARGGIYDHLGGGFARYSVDARWLVPHFEKMLYDNSLILSAIVDVFRATHDPFFEQVGRETADYALREMTSEPGGFFSTQDADSEGEEGKFYVWSEAEVREVLGDEDAKMFCYVFDVTPGGNWEGHNILHRAKTDEQDAKVLGISVEELRARLAPMKAKLLEVRGQRVWPGRDEKILAAWNGLMIAALAEAGAAFDEPRYIQAASKAATFVLGKMIRADGRLLRTCAVDQPAKLNGYLEDYAYLINGLVSLYEADFSPRWLETATELATRMIELFGDAEKGGFYYTGSDHEALITRSKDQHDGSTPSGNAMAATALLRVAALTGRDDLRAKAEETLRAFRGQLADSPMAAGQMLTALDWFLGPVREIVVVGSRGDAETQRVFRAIRGQFRPNTVVAFHDPAEGAVPELLRELFAGREESQGTVTTYVCEEFVCQEPMVGADAAESGLASLDNSST